MESNDNLVQGVSWNRLENGLCLYCGEDLLDTSESVMGMHTECRKKVEKSVRKQLGKNRDENRKRIAIRVHPDMINKKP